MEKLMEFWLDEEKGQGILLPETEGTKLGLTPVAAPEIKAVKPAETKEVEPEEDKTQSKPASKSKPKATGK